MNIASLCVHVSFVVPVFNEECTIETLVERLNAVMRHSGEDLYEIILIDDGSSDRSWPLMQTLAKSDPKVISYRLRRNFGKATALALGAQVARGSVLITLDADLQDDPTEIPRFLAKLDEGYDLVSGWKKDRKDPLSMPGVCCGALYTRHHKHGDYRQAGPGIGKADARSTS